MRPMPESNAQDTRQGAQDGVRAAFPPEGVKAYAGAGCASQNAPETAIR